MWSAGSAVLFAMVLTLRLTIADKQRWGSMEEFMNPTLSTSRVKSILPQLEPGIAEQFTAAQACLQRWQRSPDDVKSRLAAVYLYAHLQHDSWIASMLACSINRLQQNVGPSTPLDIFVFLNGNAFEATNAKLTEHLGAENTSKICLLNITHDQWRHHHVRGAPYRLPGNTNRYFDYLLMGQWRMLVPYNIMHALGYPYFLQVDEDLFVTEPFPMNIVQHMQTNDMKIATHAKIPERWDIVYGLPELARFFLLSNDLKPGGSLFQHLTPPDMTGLYSPKENWWNADSKKLGYDTHMLWGNFLVMSTALWMDDKVQDFVALAMATGGLERHRWQEQSVMAWVWLLFTEPHQLWELSVNTTFKFEHTKPLGAVGKICPTMIKVDPVLT